MAFWKFRVDQAYLLASAAMSEHAPAMFREWLIFAAVTNVFSPFSAVAQAQEMRDDNPSYEVNFILPRLPLQQEMLVLSRIDDETRLSIRKLETGAAVPRLRLNADLLDGVTLVPFGTSGRCLAEKAGAEIVMTCAQGADVAGIALQFGGALPPGAAVKGFVAAEGPAEFRLQIVNPGDDATAPIAALRQIDLPLPHDTGAPLQLVVLAPATGGKLRLTDLRLLSIPEPRPLNASAWAWQADAWRESGDQLIRSAIERDLTRLHITLVIADGCVQHADELASFIRAASRRNIAVDAVEGDPRMALNEGLPHALERARAIAKYQQSASADSRLAGVQYDIEPYVLPEWGSAPSDYADWSAAVNALSRTVESPVDLVLPFWIANDAAGLAFLRDVEASVSGVTVMSYRADGALSADLAQPMLGWGVTAGKPVRIALEAGPVASESEETFVAAAEGQLALRERDGQIMATYYTEPTSVPGARMYASRGMVLTRSDRISFLGDEQRMVESAHDVARTASAWDSFAGIGFHGLTWPQREGRTAAAKDLQPPP